VSELLAVYDRALPQVYGYLIDRCGDRDVAEDLTSETFLAAVKDEDSPVSIPWLIGVARHKLADHWRRKARDQRLVDAVGNETVELEDPWDVHLDGWRANDVLNALGEHHRLPLTLRYVDGLSVPEVAEILERTVHATEALLVRARTAFRKLYEKGGSDGDVD
jgi:RNA polymerase sigma-70 factor (ECF subfamily)